MHATHASQELMVILWKLLDINRRFLAHVLKQHDATRLLHPALFMMFTIRNSESHVCVLLLFNCLLGAPDVLVFLGWFGSHLLIYYFIDEWGAELFCCFEQKLRRKSSHGFTPNVRHQRGPGAFAAYLLHAYFL
jgi:hypothetical protein